MKRSFFLLPPLCFFWCASTLADALLVPVYLDGALEGFNSDDPPLAASTADGNPGTTLGEQRRWAFERALEYWARRLDSDVVIQVVAEMDNLPCNMSGAVLGSAGPWSVARDWSPDVGGSAPAFPNTWYAIGLANRIANQDIATSVPDIGSEFNSFIDESDACLFGTTWYYALGEAPAGTISFYATALHEIGHGLGFLTFVDLSTGARFASNNDGIPRDDVYMKFLEDHSTGMLWPEMNDAERMASATDSFDNGTPENPNDDISDLHWVGPNVLAALGSLNGGVSDGHAHMYAPIALQGGSSVSHWDIAIEDNDNHHELMEPNATGAEKLLITGALLQDIGWNAVVANNCTFGSERLSLSSTYFGSNTHEACISVTYDGAVISAGDTSATAGREVVLQNGFTVEQGATFSVQIDPDIGL